MLPGFLRQELLGIKQSLEQGSDAFYLTTLYAAPKKIKEGQIIKADGVTYNPGSGAGVYCYRGGAWTFLG
jgi:hypothetical protein